MTHRRSLLAGLAGTFALAVALLVPATTLAATPTTAGTGPIASTAAVSTVCTDGRWPLRVQGVPTLLHAGAAAGDYIWHDADGWHVRVTHRGTGKVVFSGRIVSSAPITFVRAVRLEAGDFIGISGDRKTVTYRFTNHGAIDGLSFRTDCARQLTFGGSMNGTALPVSRIWVGRGNSHPATNPFTVTRIS